MAKSSKDNSLRIILALMLFSAAFMLWHFADEVSTAPPKSKRFPRQRDLEPELNAHLHETDQALERQQIQRKLLESAVKPEVGMIVPIPKQAKEPLQLEPQQDAVDGPGAYAQSQSPEGVIQNELAEKQQHERWLQSYRQEYIRQFVENARRQGWQVEVDTNGQISRVVPVERNATMPPSNQGIPPQ